MVDTNGPGQCTKDADLLVKKKCRNLVKREEKKNGTASVRCDGLQIRSKCTVDMTTQLLNFIK